MTISVRPSPFLRSRGVLASLAGAVLWVGCVSSAGLLQRPAEYIGQNEAQLVAKLGPPLERRKTVDGGQLLLYSRAASTYQYSGLPPRPAPAVERSEYAWRTGGANAAAAVPPMDDLSSGCVVVFSLDAAGIAKAWTTQGGDCRIK